MREFPSPFASNGVAAAPAFRPPPSLFVRLPPLPSPLPSPSPSPADGPLFPRNLFFFPSIPVADGAFDFATISLIGGILLLCLLSFSFICHLRLRSRRLQHLQHFNYLWTVRLILVFMATLWALNELLRLPFLRQNYLYPFLPSLTLNQQADLCKIHVILSLGFFEPGFLVTLLFLVNTSIKKKNPRRTWALASVFMVCSPLSVLHTFFIYLSPFGAKLPKFMQRTSVLTCDMYGNKTMLCTYPLFSCLIFGAFAIAYSLAFVLSCWRVVSFVINKTIRVRVNLLATTIMVALPMQIMCLALSPLWSPTDAAYVGVVLAKFLCVAWCVVVGEIILVIRPISEALAAGGECRRWDPEAEATVNPPAGNGRTL